eukprot:5486548-Pyramimonas_sp.AAC.1
MDAMGTATADLEHNITMAAVPSARARATRRAHRPPCPARRASEQFKELYFLRSLVCFWDFPKIVCFLMIGRNLGFVRAVGAIL